MKPIIRSVRSEKAAPVGHDSITVHEWPMTTETLVKNALKQIRNEDDTAINSGIHSLIRLKILLAHAKLQIAVCKKEYRNDERVEARLIRMQTALLEIQEIIPLKVL